MSRSAKATKGEQDGNRAGGHATSETEPKQGTQAVGKDPARGIGKR
jgi:hypothetical protein